MSDQITNLLVAASAAQAAALDMIEEARDGKISDIGNIAAGETTEALAFSLSLLMNALSELGELSEAETQLLGAVERYLEDAA